jgi:hypothetical protein
MANEYVLPITHPYALVQFFWANFLLSKIQIKVSNIHTQAWVDHFPKHK